MLKAKIWSVLIFNALTFVKMEKHFNSDLATPHSVLWFWHILYLVYFAHDSFNWYWWAMDICDIYGRLLLPLPPTPGWQFGQAGAKCALNSGHQTHISGKFCTQCVVCCMKKEHVYIYMFCFTACALNSVTRHIYHENFAWSAGWKHTHSVVLVLCNIEHQTSLNHFVSSDRSSYSDSVPLYTQQVVDTFWDFVHKCQ